jgi:hypothetical protein
LKSAKFSRNRSICMHTCEQAGVGVAGLANHGVEQLDQRRPRPPLRLRVRESVCECVCVCEGGREGGREGGSVRGRERERVCV